MLEQRRRQRQWLAAPVWVRQNILTTVLIIFILLSLLLHLLTIGALLRVRHVVSRHLDISADQLSRVRQQEVRYDVPVDQMFSLDTTIAISETMGVPLSISVPIKQTIRLPVHVSVPIKQTIRLPINTPIRRFEFPVPIDMTVPISDTVEVPIDMTVPVSGTIEVPIRREVPVKAEIPIDTVIPFELDLNDSPIGDILKQLEDNLRELRNNLNE
jgi:hypothetical protein